MRNSYWLTLTIVIAMLICGIVACNDGIGADADVETDADDIEGCGEEGQACNMSTECPEYQVCVGHRCGCAYDRFYNVDITTAAIYARAEGGNCWDGVAPDCEDPDPYTIVKVDDTSYQTATKTDTINPLWNERFKVWVHHPNPNPTAYWLTMYDEDPDDEDDLIMDFPAGLSDGYPLYIKQLRQGGITVQQGSEKQRTVVKLILSPIEHE